MSNTAQFHRERQKGLGGSDIAAVLGLHPWKSPLDVWMEKTGRQAGDVSNLQVELGTLFERDIAEMYSRRTGYKIRQRKRPYIHREYPILIGHVDRLAEGGPVVECKMTSERAANNPDLWGEEWTDEIPQYYLTQVLHYLGLSGRDLGDIPVLFGNRDYRIYRVERDQSLIDDLWQQCVQWWDDHVQQDIPPAPRSEADVKSLYPESRDRVVIASKKTVDAVRELAQIQQQRKELEKREKDCRDLVTPEIGEAEQLADVDGTTLATYKSAKPAQKTDWKAVAREAGASSEIIERHTTEKPGSRRLLVKTKAE